ncbi:MAG TPA: NUDIX hydrolase N-terminal domain-containing protein [Acidimicrobiales bacterium]|nr:NUDIX hydrolase N-terminal domain-containing protein [Acidimicrobiales bacterium]
MAIDDQDIVRWSEALSAIARTGLGFTTSIYEQERFQEVLNVAADMRATVDGSQDPSEWAGEWMAGVGKGVPGYVTPKAAVGVVVGNELGEILLIQRSNSGVWLYPTGWCDVGYSPAEVAVKEVHEETGIEVEPVRIIAVLDGMRMGMTHVPLYTIVFQCRMIGGELKPHPLECLDVGFFARDALPQPLAGFEFWGEQAFAAIDGHPLEVKFDLPREPVWKGDATP